MVKRKDATGLRAGWRAGWRADYEAIDCPAGCEAVVGCAVEVLDDRHFEAESRLVFPPLVQTEDLLALSEAPRAMAALDLRAPATCRHPFAGDLRASFSGLALRAPATCCHPFAGDPRASVADLVLSHLAGLAVLAHHAKASAVMPDPTLYPTLVEERNWSSGDRHLEARPPNCSSLVARVTVSAMADAENEATSTLRKQHRAAFLLR